MKLNIDRSNWKKVRLGDVATAPSIRINNPSESGFERFIGNANIGQWDFRLTSWESTSSVTSAMKGFETGDYLFVRRSLYASDFRERSPRASFSGICSGDIITIREIPEKIASGFLIGVLNSPAIWKYVVANASGSITRRIKWRDLANYEFLLPPKDQQSKLAELLWAADLAIERYSCALKSAITFQKAAYFSAIYGTERTQIKRVAAVSNGTTPSTKQPRFWEGGSVPWLPTGKVHDKFIRKSETFITDAAIDEKKAKLKPANSTLIAMIGQGKTRGSSAMLMMDAAINQNFACVAPQSIDPSFLFYSLFFNYQRLRDISQGSNQLALNCELVGNFRIPCPDETIQSSIGNKLLIADDTIDRLSEHVTYLQSLLKSLINQIF